MQIVLTNIIELSIISDVHYIMIKCIECKMIYNNKLYIASNVVTINTYIKIRLAQPLAHNVGSVQMHKNTCIDNISCIVQCTRRRTKRPQHECEFTQDLGINDISITQGMRNETRDIEKDNVQRMCTQDNFILFCFISIYSFSIQSK